MITPRLGIIEILTILLTCVWTLGVPAVIIYLLLQINKHLKNIEEKLKDK